MHVPIKLLSNLVDPSPTNLRGDPFRESIKFEDSFSQEQASQSDADEQYAPPLNIPSLHTEIDYHNLDQKNTLPTNNNAHIAIDVEWLQQLTRKNPISPLEGQVIVNEQQNETRSLQAQKLYLTGEAGAKEPNHTTLASNFTSGIDILHLTFPKNAELSPLTMQSIGDTGTPEFHSEQNLSAELIPKAQLIESSLAYLELIKREKNLTVETFTAFGLARQPSSYINDNGKFLNSLVIKGGAKSKVDYFNLVRGSNFTNEALSGPDSLKELGMNYELSNVSITLPLKTKLKASASSLYYYSAIELNESGSANYDLGRVLQSILDAKGSPFVNSEHNSLQFYITTSLHRSSKNNIQLKHVMVNASNKEEESLASDSPRTANQVQFSATSDLNAQNSNENKFDRSNLVDAPRIHKLDISLNTWQKIFNSQISKAAFENITKLQFSINPKKLGRVSVTLQMDAGTVNVSIVSSNGHVANILQTSEGKLETLLSDHGMKLASFNVNSEHNGREKRDRAQTKESKSEIVDRDGSKMTIGLQSEVTSKAPSAHNGDYDYLV